LDPTNASSRGFRANILPFLRARGLFGVELNIQLDLVARSQPPSSSDLFQLSPKFLRLSLSKSSKAACRLPIGSFWNPRKRNMKRHLLLNSMHRENAGDVVVFAIPRGDPRRMKGDGGKALLVEESQPSAGLVALGIASVDRVGSDFEID